MRHVWKKVLKVDLSKGTCKAEPVPEKVYEYFLGGEGLGAYFLWKESPRGTLPFDPANCLTFGAGTINGIKQSGADKWATTAISPSVYLNAGSAATASFGIEIKAAGYDAIVVTGRADKPVYLLVDDDKAMLKDASHLWGKDAYEAEDAIHAADGDNFEVASIGQAGERGVRFANIQTRKKSYCGRSGMGAIMGSKLLKADRHPGNAGSAVSQSRRAGYAEQRDQPPARHPRFSEARVAPDQAGRNGHGDGVVCASGKPADQQLPAGGLAGRGEGMACLQLCQRAECQALAMQVLRHPVP